MKIISVHTPKAGGTSVMKAFQRTFGSKFSTDYTEDPVDPRSARNSDPLSYFSRGRRLPDDIDCLHGHFHPGQFDLGDVFLFTILRDPVDNIISIYFYWKSLPSQGQPLHDFFISQQLDIFDTAKLPPLRYLYSSTYFGGFDMSRFGLVGRHEKRQDAIGRLNRALGITIESSIHENSTPHCSARDELLTNSSKLGKLREILQDDIRFYEKFAA